MKKYNIITVILIFLTLVVSCNNNDVSDVKVESGTADFSKYVALGNSLTSGYRDNALYISGQRESYPAIIAEQMKRAGGGDFKIPYMSDELGGIPSVGVNNKLILSVVGSSLAPVLATGTATTTLDNIYSQGPFQNLGVPGAKSFHLIAPGYGNPANLASGNANPYFVRFASSANATVLEDAVSQNPTFFSLWIGNNDVLGYATSGGDGSNSITATSQFQSAYLQLVQGLVAKGAKGVVANLPNVTSIPFFTTVPYNPLTPATLTASDPNQIEKLNQAFSQLNQVFDYLNHPERKVSYSSTSSNPVLIKDKALTDLSAQITQVLVSQGISSTQAALYGSLYGQSRQATKSDYLLLTISGVLGKPNSEAINSGVPAELAVNGITYPLADKWVLTSDEIANINTATTQFNSIIKSTADQYGLAFADVNSLMVDLSGKSGIIYDGVTYTSKFVTGGAFSLDGVHPTSRGYAFIANEFIKAINKKYLSNLPQVNPNIYQGITFP
ncbi:SGNH/GDSL hydrolase family protein [Apibacter sp. HY039]|uniref:SGNH/GDSL hydrolase family protein n=1 Tax=Apibacter sp. HY039 TaxID=2501476 RepID=UPI000FEC05FC|nr:SGNH/GDSL hydrolase family protein [Apibacter sp. HY039]